MKKIVLLSALGSIALYGADENNARKTHKRKCDDNAVEQVKSRRSAFSGYTNITIVDKTKSQSKPIIIQTPSFISNQASEAEMMSDQCWNVMESTIKNTFGIQGSLKAYHPQQCIFNME